MRAKSSPYATTLCARACGTSFHFVSFSSAPVARTSDSPVGFRTFLPLDEEPVSSGIFHPGLIAEVSTTHAHSVRGVNVPPLIGIATTKTPKPEYTWCSLPVDGCAAKRTRRCAHFRNCFCHSLNFAGRPPTKPVPQWVFSATQFRSFAADRQVVVPHNLAGIGNLAHTPGAPHTPTDVTSTRRKSGGVHLSSH